jgi:hypothetical protein
VGSREQHAREDRVKLARALGCASSKLEKSKTCPAGFGSVGVHLLE